jgi:cytidylate kinase
VVVARQSGFRVITISREYGSGGAEIGRRITDRLHWKLVDDPLVGEIARRARVPRDVAQRYDECVNPWFQRLLHAVWRGGFEGSASSVETGAFDADQMTRLWVEVIQEAAELGQAVIIGRGGQCILRERRDTFHVSVHAPLEVRIRNLRQELGLREGVAELAEETDRRRAAYIRRYYGEDWKGFRLYHLMINSSMGLDRAAEVILAAAGLAPQAVQPATP